MCTPLQSPLHVWLHPTSRAPGNSHMIPNSLLEAFRSSLCYRPTHTLPRGAAGLCHKGRSLCPFSQPARSCHGVACPVPCLVLYPVPRPRVPMSRVPMSPVPCPVSRVTSLRAISCHVMSCMIPKVKIIVPTTRINTISNFGMPHAV